MKNFFEQTEFLPKDQNFYHRDFKILENKTSGQFYEFQQSRKWREFGIFANFSIFTQF